MKILSIIAAVAFLYVAAVIFVDSKNQKDPATQTVIEYGRALAGENRTRSVEFNGHSLEIEVNAAETWGAKQDWNSFASSIYHVSKNIFLQKPEVKQVFIKAYGEGNKTMWASFQIDRKDLPGNWEKATYLQFFSLGSPFGVATSTKSTLCAFYQEYSSARPASEIPEYCTRYR